MSKHNRELLPWLNDVVRFSVVVSKPRETRAPSLPPFPSILPLLGFTTSNPLVTVSSRAQDGYDGMMACRGVWQCIHNNGEWNNGIRGPLGRRGGAIVWECVGMRSLWFIDDWSDCCSDQLIGESVHTTASSRTPPSLYWRPAGVPLVKLPFHSVCNLFHWYKAKNNI